MSWHYYEIKFSTLEQSVSEIGVILRIFSLISNVFMKIYEYSKWIFFITYHKVRVLCHSITLKSSLVPLED